MERRPLSAAPRGRLATHAVIVATLAVTVAALLAAIAIAHNFFVSPWPYDTARIGVLTHRTPQGTAPAYTFNGRELRALRDSGLFAATTASRTRTVALADAAGIPQRASLIHTLPDSRVVGGVAPLLGRFVEAGDVALAQVVISHALWQSRFGGAADVVGRTLRIDDREVVVVGVMPPRYHLMGGDLWTAHERDPVLDPAPDRRYVVNVLAAPGRSIDAAAGALAELARQLAQEGPAERYPPGWSIQGHRVIDAVMGPMRPAVALLLGAAALMLLVALVNIATLLNIRQVEREAEFALRRALGADSGRLLLQAFGGHLVLATLGVVLGWALGGLAFRFAVGRISNDWIPRELEGEFAYTGASLGWMPLVVLACAGLMLLAQWPRLRARRGDAGRMHAARTGIGAATLRALRGLAAGQVAAAALVAVLAALVSLGAQHLRNRAPGLVADGVLATRVAWPPERYADGAARLAYMERLATAPGVGASAEELAFVNAAPFQRFSRAGTVQPEGGAEASLVEVGVRSQHGPVAELLRIPLRRGRNLDARDRADSEPVVVINESLAHRLWGSANPLDRALRVDGDPRPRRVVGVLADAHWRGVAEPVAPMLFLPYAQDPAPPTGMVVLARGIADAAPLMRAAADIDPWTALFEPVALSDRERQTLAGLNLAESVFTSFGLLATLLALLGTAVVLRFLGLARRREFAVRAALGAAPGRLFGSVLGDGLVIGVAGIGLGLLAAWPVAGVVDEALDAAAPWRPMAALAAGAALLLVALAASFAPAWRAARTAPGEVLRDW